MAGELFRLLLFCQMHDPFVRFPTVLRAGDDANPLVYERVTDHFAVRSDAPQATPGRSVARIEDEPSFSIQEGDAADAYAAMGSAALLPVYRLGPSGALSVPTGAVFVRFEEGAAPADRTEALQEAGYRIASVPAYAPHTAWLEERTGDLAEALAGIRRLGAIPGLVRVEPQMLSPAARKSG